MAAQPGKDFLLKLFHQASASYQTVAGLRTKRLVLNQQAVDITDAESAGQWRELLTGAGIRRASVSASGIFKDKASDETVRAAFFDGVVVEAQLVIPDFGTLSGPVMITALEYSGTHDGELNFDIALESAGALTFAEAN